MVGMVLFDSVELCLMLSICVWRESVHDRPIPRMESVHGIDWFSSTKSDIVLGIAAYSLFLNGTQARHVHFHIHFWSLLVKKSIYPRNQLRAHVTNDASNKARFFFVGYQIDSGESEYRVGLLRIVLWE